MKNLVLLLLAVLFISPVLGQTGPPRKTKKAFAAMVPEVNNVEWTTDNERELYKNRIWTANYELNGDSVLSRFDYKANWVITLTFIDVDELPDTVVQTIQSEYNGSKLIKAAKLEEPGFDGYGVAYLFKEDKWSVQISKEGEIVRRILQGEAFAFD